MFVPLHRRQIIASLASYSLALAACGTSHENNADFQEHVPTVKVAAVQCSSDLGAVADNSRKLTDLIREAAANHAKIIVLPETAITGYISQDLRTNWHVPGRPIESAFRGRNPITSAETVPGLSTERFCSLAKELKVYLTIPLLERVGELPTVTADAGDEDSPQAPTSSAVPAVNQPRYFNTVCLANPDGILVAHYRKLNPWPYPEKSWATPGDRGIQTYDTEYGRVGLAICFDIHTVLEQYESAKLWALLYPIAWVDEEHPADWFWHKLPPRIARFHHHLIGANWSVDQPQRWRGYGFSTIIAPSGQILATSKTLYGSEIIYANLPTASKNATRP
jgi:predicted amidohydrolase